MTKCVGLSLAQWVMASFENQQRVQKLHLYSLSRPLLYYLCKNILLCEERITMRNLDASSVAMNPNNKWAELIGEIHAMQSLYLLSTLLKNRVILTYRQGRSSLFVCHTKKLSIQKVILPKKAPFSRLRVDPQIEITFHCPRLMPNAQKTNILSCRQMYAST